MDCPLSLGGPGVMYEVDGTVDAGLRQDRFEECLRRLHG